MIYMFAELTSNKSGADSMSLSEQELSQMAEAKYDEAAALRIKSDYTAEDGEKAAVLFDEALALEQQAMDVQADRQRKETGQPHKHSILWTIKELLVGRGGN